MENPTGYRIESIDALRGIVMVLMALDHARDYFGVGSFSFDPTDLGATTPSLFLTRWITHFCAPVFVFLAGTSVYLYGTRGNSKKEVARFLLARGAWLVFLELTIVNFGWTFDVTLSFHILQVIWAIGISMIFLSVIIFLPKWTLLAVGIVLVAGHNALDLIHIQETTVLGLIWSVLHQRSLIPLGQNSTICLVYPVLPWIGLMILGYAFGELYHKGFDAKRRKMLLLAMGICAVVLFIIFRTFNIYGDPNQWEPQKTPVFSILSFLNTTKYPPSLLFILMTMGLPLFFLGLVEGKGSRTADFFVVLGRVPLFFYVIHIYCIHLLGIVGVILAGRKWTDMILTAKSFSTRSLADYGYGLPVVYLVWTLIVIFMFPLCKWYGEFKRANRSKWWLRYL